MEGEVEGGRGITGAMDGGEGGEKEGGMNGETGRDGGGEFGERI